MKKAFSFLLLVSLLGLPLAANAEEDKPYRPDLATAIAANATFNQLTKALEAADLMEALKAKGPFTIFAPTNDAFEKLPAGTIEHLLKPENKEQLAALLTYHVVPATKKGADLASGELKTVNGSSLNVTKVFQKVKVNDANVIFTDLEAANGVIHLVDAVILPPAS